MVEGNVNRRWVTGVSLGLMLAVVATVGQSCNTTDVEETTTNTPATTSATPAPGVNPSDVEEAIVNTDVDSDEAASTGVQIGEAAEAAPVVAGAAVEIDVIARQFEFEPSTITVSEGDVVTLNIESTDVDHGFGLPEFGVSELLSPGETTTVTFTADKAGSYSFFCSVFCGGGHGSMKGTLIVE